MRKVRNVFKKSISLLISLSLVFSIFGNVAFAVTTDKNPAVLGVSMNETRSYISILFDRDIEPTTTNLVGKLKLSTGGRALTMLPYNAKVTVSGTYMYVTLPTPLTTSDNFFSITSGTLVGQDKVVETPLFDARGPELHEDATRQVTIDADKQTVTIHFNREIKGYPNDDSLKNGYITLARNGSSFFETIPADDISINNTDKTITIYLDEWLTGSRARFCIAAGKLQDSKTGNINLSDIMTNYIDASKTTATPEIDYINLDADRKTISIYFTDRIKNGLATGVSSTVANNLLKSHIWLGRGSSTKFETLGGADSLTVGSNYLRIVLAEPLTSSRNYIKIEGTSLTDYYGNYIRQDIVTDNFTSGTSATVAKPAYASAFLSSSNRIVLYFTTTVQKNPVLSTSQLRENIKIARNGVSYEELSSYDSVSFSDNTMTITLRESLTGSSNRVKISPNTIASKSGLLLDSTVVTTSLVAGMADSSSGNNYYDDEEAPEYSHITYDASSQRIKVYFDRDIRKVSSANYYEDIYIMRNGGSFKPLATSNAVTISPANALTILLSEPLSGTRNAIRISGGTISDYDSGYVQNNTITSDYISAAGETDSSSSSSSSASAPYSGDVITSVSEDLYTVTVKFDEAVYNNKDSLEELKDKIQISRKGSFKTLSSDDYIRFNSENNELLIVLAEPANEYFSQIKILSGSLRTADGTPLSNTITTLPLGESIGEAKTYIDEVAVNDITSVQTTGTSTVATISGLSKFNTYTREIELLVKVPSNQNSATLNIMGDIVDTLKRYGGTIALSLGDTTYYLPSSNIPSVAPNDTLSITIENSDSTVSQKLASEASSQNFTIESPSKKLQSKIISASGSSTEITHKDFAEKRFLIKNASAEKTAYTVVRIESSGSVVPVPTSAGISGIVYLTSKTLSDGNYASISSSKTLKTLSWVQTPTNLLASRLILTGKDGSSLDGNEAISRSETVTIMSRTLGILGDMNGASPFFDMISTDKYFNAVMSTVEYELISGYPDSTFKPSNKLTRAEAMTIVARAMRFMNGKSVSESSDMTLEQATNILSKFTDANTVDNWAKVNIAECVQAGVVNGDNNGRLNPKSNVTRAELIQLMYNILKTANML